MKFPSIVTPTKLANLSLVAVITAALALSGCATSGSSSSSSSSATMKVTVSEARTSLNQLTSSDPSAASLARKAKAVLVFPRVVKGGLMVGGQYGEGILFKNGAPSGTYNVVSASYGLQAGVQAYGYAVFFMTNDALGYLDRSEGWEIGSAPSVVVVDQGLARTFSTTSLRENIYVYFFDQKGLMAGLGLQGTKITRVR